MKKLLFLLIIGLSVSFALHAQSFRGKIADSTLTNATTASFTIPVTGAKGTVTFQYVITKTSGTVAGTVILLGTVDGTNYVTLNTYNLTDATVTTGVNYAYNPYAKYKVTVTTTGTQVSNYKIWALYR